MNEVWKISPLKFVMSCLLCSVVGTLMGGKFGAEIARAEVRASHNAFHSQMSELGVNAWCYQWRASHRLSESEKEEIEDETP